MKLIMLLISLNLFAIDNPDAVNEFDQFQNSLKAKNQLFLKAQTTKEMVDALHEIESLCEKELIALVSEISKKSKQKQNFKLSQKKWEAYKEEEDKMLGQLFQTQSQGSSSVVDYLQAKVEILKNRVSYLYKLKSHFLAR